MDLKDIPYLRYAGVDPVFKASVRVHICQIYKMTSVDNTTGVFNLNGHPVMSVCIMGRVVKIHRSEKFTKYGVDDGTGVITVVCWPEKPIPRYDINTVSSVLGQCLTDKLRKLVDEKRKRGEEPYEFGDLLFVQGRPKMIYDNLELSAQNHVRLENAMHEVLHLAEVPRLYNMAYSKPFEWPPLVKQELSGEAGDVTDTHFIQKALLVEEVVSKLVSDVCHSPSDLTYDVTEIQTLLQSFLLDKGMLDPKEQDEIVQSALSLLLQQGHVFVTNHLPRSYTFVSRSEQLQHAILKIVRDYIGAHPERELQGCHVVHINQSLRRIGCWSQVSKEAVNRCLAILEEKSEVFSPEPLTYLVFNG